MYNPQEWITALQGHRAYSEYYTTTTYIDDEYDDVTDDFMSLGSLADSLKVKNIIIKTCNRGTNLRK